MIDLNIKLPEGYLQEEMRYGYVVTQKTKEVWAVELDLLQKLLCVCDRYQICCYADAGTLLGAARHGGFIPWDDDIDMVIFREDYEKLLMVAEKEFQYPYCFQSPYGKENYPHGHAQLRNSMTTGILKSDLRYGYQHNQGIFIDIFILDAVVDDERKLEKQCAQVTFWKWMAKLASIQNIEGYSKKSKFLKRLLNIFHITSKPFYTCADWWLKRYKVPDYEFVAPLGFVFETEKRIRNRHIYDEKAELPFEFLTIPVPAQYTDFLSRRYGDYRKPLQVPTTHGEVFFDTNLPYTEYLCRKGKTSC